MLPAFKEGFYPNLRSEGYRVTSQETFGRRVRYNCVAWAALGDTEKWWQAGQGPGFYWPPGIPDDDSLLSYISVFKLLGYKECSSANRELFYEKIAIYTDVDGGFAHVCYQLFRGWTSKLGDWEDIRHSTLEALESESYGKATVFLKRRTTFRGVLARISLNFIAPLWPIKRP